MSPTLPGALGSGGSPSAPWRLNRSSLQTLAELRREDARVLLENGRFEAAYYLAGYAVECAFKACLAKRTQEYDFPGKAAASRECSCLVLWL
jgi:HEPN domain